MNPPVPSPDTTDSPAQDSASAPRRPAFGFVKRHGLLADGHIEDGHARVFYRPDFDVNAVAEMRRFLAAPMQLVSVDALEFDRLMTAYYEHGSDETMQAMEGIGDDMDLSSVAEALAEPEDLLEAEDDAPIIRLINALLSEAIKEGASDVHIEPQEARLMVRFRLNGVLREVLQPKRELAPLLSSRIKVMAKLDIAEKRVPQDGRISLRLAGRAVDVRVSTMPSAHGERVVLRLLDKHAGRLSLSHLGMEARPMELLDELIQHPHGIFLVTGPTGSGKTTTLYAALDRLNDASRNIMTVEDPIEYYLDGIGQSQVNTKVDMSFARGLRAILRQDPDVVMVGEIRDIETADIAVQSSLTGHMVFSTLHTNTAVGAVTRLRDMGVEPFLLASSLLGVLAQRLVRVLCEDCREAYQANDKELERLGEHFPAGATLYRATGCPHCNHTGYTGRTGIYELFVVDDQARAMIHDGEGEAALFRHARTLTPSIWEHGVARVASGATSLEELLRVTQQD